MHRHGSNARTILVAVAVLCAHLQLAGGAFASQGSGRFRFAEEDQVVNVTPVVVNRTIRAGATATIEVRVENQTERSFDFVTELRDLGPGTSPGQDKRIEPAGSLPLSAAEWARVTPDRFHLAGGQRQVVRVRVAPPTGAPPGGRYAALVVGILPPPGGQVAITTQVNVLLLLTVDGPLTHDLRVTVTPRSRLLWRATTARWRIRVENRGNVHENIAGRLNADALLGGSRSVATRSMIVLPGATREFTTAVRVRSSPDILWGRWRYVSGEKGAQRVQSAPPLLVVPLWFMVTLALALGAIAWRLRRRDEDE